VRFSQSNKLDKLTGPHFQNPDLFFIAFCCLPVAIVSPCTDLLPVRLTWRNLVKKVIAVPQSGVSASPPKQRESQAHTQKTAPSSSPIKASLASGAPIEAHAHGAIPASNPGEKQDEINHILEHLRRDRADGIHERMLSSRETASLLNMSQSWLNKQRVSGGEDTIPFHKLGRRVLYDPRDVRAALLKSRRHNTSQ
jgi:hypothetical protein